jgi:hypothetical protein
MGMELMIDVEDTVYLVQALLRVDHREAAIELQEAVTALEHIIQDNLKTMFEPPMVSQNNEYFWYSSHAAQVIRIPRSCQDATHVGNEQ